MQPVQNKPFQACAKNKQVQLLITVHVIIVFVQFGAVLLYLQTTVFLNYLFIMKIFSLLLKCIRPSVWNQSTLGLSTADEAGESCVSMAMWKARNYQSKKICVVTGELFNLARVVGGGVGRSGKHKNTSRAARALLCTFCDSYMPANDSDH